jgi:hypothetical protein
MNTPTYPSQYPQAQYSQPAPADGPKGFAITSMVLGICSLVIPYAGIILGILAVVFGAVSRNKNESGRGMAIAGLVTGIVALALWLIVIIIVAASS